MGRMIHKKGCVLCERFKMEYLVMSTEKLTRIFKKYVHFMKPVMH